MWSRPVRRRRHRAGYTMIELIMVMIIIGILGAVAAGRFFDHQVAEARAYADQAKSLLRYAQKLAIAQNRLVFVRATPSGFAVCFDAGAACAAGNQAQAPGGTNNGTTATRAFCVSGANLYNANWACLGQPTTVAVASTVARNEMAANGYFYFDPAGRPFNRNDATTAGAVSSFTRLTVNVSSGAQRATFNVEAETGYVF